MFSWLLFSECSYLFLAISSVEAVSVGERVRDLHGREAVVRAVPVPTPLHLFR